MYESLRQVPLFEGWSEDDLADLCSEAEEVTLDAGDTLFEEGEVGDRAYVITGGEVEIVKESTGREVLLAVRRANDVIGEMALLEDKPRMATARARSEATLVSIPRPALDELLATSATAARAMFHTILARWQGTESQLRQSERMAQLGTLTAGVAHELNNPSSAVKRAAGQLHGAVTDYGEAHARFRALGLERADVQAVTDLLERAHQLEGKPDEIDTVTRMERETELETWLEGRGIAEPWTAAPDLVSLGVEPSDLDALGIDGQEALGTIVDVVTATYRVHTLVTEVERGGSRVFEIAKALKSYSYLDQAPVQEVDVRAGLDDTLLILRSKLGDIEVSREYADDLPTIQAHGSELNQVWTNLIDNAVDAIAESGRGDGRIALRAFRDGDRVVVDVEDNGTGIPEELRDRVFDSFFTTKPPGQGTGLGLDISYGIVVMKHRGDLTVDSEPGRTRFRVQLPLAV